MALENYADLVQTTWYPPRESDAGVLFKVVDEHPQSTNAHGNDNVGFAADYRQYSAQCGVIRPASLYRRNLGPVFERVLTAPPGAVIIETGCGVGIGALGIKRRHMARGPGVVHYLALDAQGHMDQVFRDLSREGVVVDGLVRRALCKTLELQPDATDRAVLAEIMACLMSGLAFLPHGMAEDVLRNVLVPERIAQPVFWFEQQGARQYSPDKLPLYLGVLRQLFQGNADSMGMCHLIGMDTAYSLAFVEVPGGFIPLEYYLEHHFEDMFHVEMVSGAQGVKVEKCAAMTLHLYRPSRPPDEIDLGLELARYIVVEIDFGPGPMTGQDRKVLAPASLYRPSA